MRPGSLGDGLRRLTEDLPASIDMAEIGVYAGSSTLIFLESGKVKSLLAVDPWMDELLSWEVKRHNVPMEDVYQTFVARVSQKHPQVTAVRKTSGDAAAEAAAQGRTFDFVYIDGDHSYESCIADIKAWLPLIRPGGVIAGHDHVADFPGVAKAVAEMFGAPDKLYPDNSWLKRL